MNVERLKRLRDIMVAINEIDPNPGEDNSLFNLSYWVGDSKGLTNKEDHIQAPEQKDLSSLDFVKCGSACCALGWAAVDPLLSSQGLYLKKAVGFGHDVIRFKESKNYEAGARFFDITERQSKYLFDPESFMYDSLILDNDGNTLYDSDLITPQHVITRIDEILGGYEGRDPEEYE